jgi:uncharacterized protein (DUF1501 family)
MKRQIFFCQLGGFDTHSSQIAGQNTLLSQVSAAMRAFYDATVELGVANNVTTFYPFRFRAARCRRQAHSTQAGSDHGWGNHHFIMGGSVIGGRFYGTYPTLGAGRSG